MAYALNYPNAPTDDQNEVAAESAAPKGFFARMLGRIERAQTARFHREIALYSPHIYETLLVHREHAGIGLSDDHKLPFVR